MVRRKAAGLGVVSHRANTMEGRRHCDTLMVTAAVEHEALAKDNIATHNANGLLTVLRSPWISPSVTYDSASCRRGAASVQEGWMNHLPQ